MRDDMSVYFSGQKLYGDDFSLEQLKLWYDEEKEGYAGSVLSRNKPYQYKYHELNTFYGYRHIKLRKGSIALGLGSAYGSEFLPILPYIDRLTIVDPSDEFAHNQKLKGVPVTYVKPATDGTLAFADNTFDIITCLGVLHHIANVSKVLSECYRCLRRGGVMLCREPIVTQGDWRRPRRGLTKNERGIPLHLLNEMARGCGFEIERIALFDFSPFARIMDQFGIAVFAHRFTTRLDHLLSQLFSFNTKYHRVKTMEKFGPAAVYIVLRKGS